MKKRIVSLLLSVVMLISLLSVNAFAADKFTLKGSTHELEKVVGQTISFKVDITKNPGMIAGKFTVKWDNTALELTGVTFNSKGYPDRGTPEEITSTGSFPVSFGDYLMKSNSTFTGTLATLTFKVLAAAETKTYPITVVVNSDDMMDKDGNEVACEAVNGSITLKAKTVAVTSVAVSPKTLNLEEGQTGTLTATVKPDNATNKTVTWTTSNDKVATVANGVVTAVGKGTATITAAADGKTATCTVTVKVPAHKHTPVAVPAQESTCMEKGWEAYYKCSACGTVVDENGNAAQIKYLPLAAHKLTETKAVPATCTEDGTEAYWTCSVCKKMFADKDGKKEIKAPVKVAALGHDIGEKTLETAGVAGSKLALYSATCKTCDKKVYTAMLEMPDNTLNVVAKQSDNSKKDFSKAVTFGVKASDSKETLKFTIDPVTDDIVKAAKTEAGYKVTETIYKNGAYGWGLADYSETPEAAYAALAEYLKNGITFTQTISAKENTWAADAKSHTMTFDINTADGTFTVKVDGKNESTITFTNTFTYKTVSPGGGGNGGSTTTDTTKNDGKKVESGKTFDAGIAMYVGLSVLSVTGGALVIGKKKERF
jgi:hypothetical protein